jgi:formylglycine-generating enzyme required for sulfatase activity/predicted esterase
MTKPVAYRGTDPYAFVAYSHEDERRVHGELDWINRQGFNAYYDDGIAPGHRWREEIASAIDRAAVFIFFISPRSVASSDCIRELDYALGQNKPVLAVHLDPTELPSGVKLAINDRQAIHAHAMSPTDYRLRFLEALGEYLTAVPEGPRTERDPRDKGLVSARRRRWLLIYLPVPALLLLLMLLIAIGRWWDPFGSRAEDHVGLARADALELLHEAEELAEDDQYARAFYLIRTIDEVLNDHPDLARLKAGTLRSIRPRIREHGANVWFRPRQIGAETDWIDVGTTPVSEFPAPLGVLEFKVEKDGFQTGHFLVANPGPLLGNQTEDWPGRFAEMELAPVGSDGGNWIPIPAASNQPVNIQGTPQQADGGADLVLPSFAIARAEVTNRAFKQFVDDDGYDTPAFWADLTMDDGAPFRIDEQRAQLVDTTGRSAPAGWELANFPPGEADFPVGGISWYEAMAYARYRNLMLPTVYHWARAAQGPAEAAHATVGVVARLGNYNATAPRPASNAALGPWGTYDMAGNVREWVQNRTSRGRLAMGGSWNDYESVYFQAYPIRSMDRSPDNGMRLMKAPGIDAQLLASIELLIDSPRAFRDPVSDEHYRGMRSQFVASQPPLDSAIKEVLEDSPERRIEELTLRYADNSELVLYLAVPQPARGALQSVIYMGDSGAFLFGPSPNRDTTQYFDSRLDFVVRSGRAAVIPIWYGSRERNTDVVGSHAAQVRAATGWHTDLVRTIKYLEDRDDLADDKIAFMGFSFGALFGPIVLAQESRLKTAVLISGGIYSNTDLHETMDLINYAPRIRQPVLLVNGRFDPIVPYGLSQQRLLELLPHAQSTQVLFDELGHWGFPRHRFYREVTDWLDEQLGPVR